MASLISTLNDRLKLFNVLEYIYLRVKQIFENYIEHIKFISTLENNIL